MVIGDLKTPSDFQMNNCTFISLNDQQNSEFEVTSLIPENSYSRKMIGYLFAMKIGAERIFETDDDNEPLRNFSDFLKIPEESAGFDAQQLWINAYSHFTASRVWPRGFPLEEISKTPGKIQVIVRKSHSERCVIQYLVDNDPDVDAVFRMTQPQQFPITFEPDKSLIIPSGAYSPFNSQSTDWPVNLIELMYLPSTCSFRMTDIWRGLIAQRIFRECGFELMFRSPIMAQFRNEHDLLIDFSREIEGFLNYQNVVTILNGIEILTGVENISKNLRLCYEILVANGIFQAIELEILIAYIRDIKRIRSL